MLEGKLVNLTIMEKDDLPLFVEWVNKPEVFGEYNPLHQMSKTEAEKMLDNPSDLQPFIVEKKDGSARAFHVLHLETGTKQLEIGYSLVPGERGKGYGPEALKIMIDYLFLSKDATRIQVQTDLRNVASQKIIEKVARALTTNYALVAPCGMNCALCSGYLALKHDLKTEGIKMTHCTGCRPRNKKCTWIKKQCAELSKGEITFCYECKSFPSHRLMTIDERYRSRYRMSMIENLKFIKAHGIEKFLEEQEKSWKYKSCGEMICCHNGLCFRCDLEKLRNKKQKYRWNEKWKLARAPNWPVALKYYIVISLSRGHVGCEYSKNAPRCNRREVAWRRRALVPFLITMQSRVRLLTQANMPTCSMICLMTFRALSRLFKD